MLDDFVDELLIAGKSLKKALRTKLPSGFKRPKGEPKRFKNIHDEGLKDNAGNWRPLKSREYIEIDNTHSIWKDAGGDVYHDSVIGDSLKKRLGTELDFPAARDASISHIRTGYWF